MMSEKKLPAAVWRPLAAYYLLQTWIWVHLGGAIKRLVAALPLESFKNAVRRVFDALPASVALAAFLLPFAIVEPLKFTIFHFIAKKQYVLALLDFLTLKAISLGLISFLFDAGREKFLSIGWFRRLYDILTYWNQRAHELLAPYQQRLKEDIRRLKTRFEAQGSSPAFVWLRRRIQRFFS